ncbi:MAG: aldo/keto reductase [Planctomycetota bacterium]
MSTPNADRRAVAHSSKQVSAVAFGCWPIAGVTTLGANKADSLATVQAALDAGINHFDTAYVYGPNGESDAILAEALAGGRDEVYLATKGGVHYEGDSMAQDARPDTLKAECEASLKRLGTDHVDLLYLHSPDPNVTIEESAGALRELKEAGKTLAVGASNCTLEQLQAFHAVCPLAAVQLPYNLLQRGIEEQTLPWCQANGVAAMTYWPLMKGLLADGLPRNGKLDPNDKRLTYPMYQGEEWERNQAFLAELRTVAESAAKTVAQVVINWTMHRPGITSVLCGAKRPWQIEETAGAMGWQLDEDQLAAIDAALDRRGEAAANRQFT